MSNIGIEYGNRIIDLNLPFEVDNIGMVETPTLIDPQTVYTHAFLNPIGCKPLSLLAREKRKTAPNQNVVILVSDNTRPTPYKGKDGLLFFLLNTLLNEGYRQEEISILIGNGSHREMTETEIEEMLELKKNGFSNVKVDNHRYANEEELVYIGTTKRGGIAKINKRYVEAGFKIVTGLIESHFMAGASGGPKGICPAIVSKQTLEIFHGALLLSSPFAADLEITQNPVQSESTEIALMAGCDFLVNVTLDYKKRLTGVFCGDMIKAHRKGIEFVKTYITFPVKRKYDIVIIPAGFVGINHYQTAKAAVIASRVVKVGGSIIIIAKNTDTDPIGGVQYKKVLKTLKELGVETFKKSILSAEWSFIQEQWQAQLWCKAFEILQSFENLIYCSTDIPLQSYDSIPCLPGIQLVKELPTIENIVYSSIMYAYQKYRIPGFQEPSILFLKDGPYGIPVMPQNEE
jgi:nickel-dependent lactate racemase